MLIKTQAAINCNDSSICARQIITRLENKYNLKLMGSTETDKINGHVSISHKQNDHTVWFFAYDVNNIHEAENENIIVTQPNNRVLHKPVNPRPTRGAVRSEIERP